MITLTPSNAVPNTYSLKWGAQQSHILDGLRNLVLVGGQDDLLLTDVTLACDGEYISAHKLVLSLCSAFFKDLFQKNRADKSNTIVIVSHVNAQNLRYLLQFMYQGRVDIPSKDVDSFLQAGNLLKIEGLIGDVGGGDEPEPPQSRHQYQQSTSTAVPSPATASSSYRPPRTNAPPPPKIVQSLISLTPKCDSSHSSATPNKKPRLTDMAASSSSGTIPNRVQVVDSRPIIVGTLTSDEPSSRSDLPAPTGAYDPLVDNPNDNEYSTGEMEEGGEEGVDFDNLKTEPIHVYSGYEEANQSELIDEGNEDEETYEESGEDSYGIPPANISITSSASIAGAVGSGPSTSTQSQVNRPRGNLPVILNGQFFQVLISDEEGRVKAKCMVCEKDRSKNVLISGRFTTTSNYTTHLKRKHAEHFKAYEGLLLSKGRKSPWHLRCSKSSKAKRPLLVPNQEEDK